MYIGYQVHIPCLALIGLTVVKLGRGAQWMGNAFEIQISITARAFELYNMTHANRPRCSVAMHQLVARSVFGKPPWI